VLSREPALDVSALNGVRVLVVEDTWHVAKAMKGALELLGMHVIGPTPTTAEARRLTAAHKPRLALVDLNLKREMACGLIDELYGQGIHVVVVSGYASIPVAEDKVAGHLQKPFSATELIKVLGTVVRLPH
jgi:DNA-binding NtrC family response regulator